MFISPDSAQEKWCPFVRPAMGMTEAAPYNRESNGAMPLWCICIADDCMMWRQLEDTTTPTGYCGLAGKPA